jgi:hypothetical protein
MSAATACCLRVGRPSGLGGLDFRENRLVTQSDTRDAHDFAAVDDSMRVCARIHKLQENN